MIETIEDELVKVYDRQSFFRQAIQASQGDAEYVQYLEQRLGDELLNERKLLDTLRLVRGF